MVDRKMQLITNTSNYKLYSDGVNHILHATFSSRTWNKGWTTVDTIPSEYKDYYPIGGYLFITVNTNLLLNINEKGEIKIFNKSNGTITAVVSELFHYA